MLFRSSALGLERNVRFVNEYVDTPTLQAWLSACDIYVTPYLTEAQITSGTLSYSVGLGKAVVSTPYWHAQELLSDGCGVLVPFASPDALAKAVSDLLGDGRRRDELRRSAYQAGRAMIERASRAHMPRSGSVGSPGRMRRRAVPRRP